MKLTKISIGIFFTICLVSCSYYSVPTDSLVSQVKENQTIEKNAYFQQFALINYPSNNLERIKCLDKKGNKVWLYPDKNTEFNIVKKSDGKAVRAYFDTVILQNDTLYGLRSRLVGGLRIIPVNDVEKVTIRAEFPKTESID